MTELFRTLWYVEYPSDPGRSEAPTTATRCGRTSRDISAKAIGGLVEPRSCIAADCRDVSARTVSARTVSARTVSARTVSARTASARTVSAPAGTSLRVMASPEGLYTKMHTFFAERSDIVRAH